MCCPAVDALKLANAALAQTSVVTAARQRLALAYAAQQLRTLLPHAAAASTLSLELELLTGEQGQQQQSQEGRQAAEPLSRGQAAAGQPWWGWYLRLYCYIHVVRILPDHE